MMFSWFVKVFVGCSYCRVTYSFCGNLVCRWMSIVIVDLVSCVFG